MINPDGKQSTFWRICDDQGVCHCDWRLTLGSCEEHEAMVIMYIINAVWSGIVSGIAIALLYYRVFYRKQKIFDCRTPTGFVRPKPIEAMLFMAILFNLLRMIQAIILVTDTAPNPIFRSFIYEIPWQFGLGAFSCYVFGIAHTVSDSSKTIYNAWFHSPVRIDILGTTFITLPFISNNICSIAAGIFADRGDDFLASQFTHALYYFWTIYCGSLGFMILVAGIRLLRLLEHHLKMQHDLRINIAKIKTGAFKVKAIMFIGCLCLWVFAFILCMYGVFRDPITRSTGLNLAISAVWTYDGPMASILVELALILNPRMTASLGVSGVSGSGSQSDPSGTITTTDGRNITTFETTNSKWDKYNSSTRSSIGNGYSQTIISDGGLPQYAVNDVSMDFLKGDGRNYTYDPPRPPSPSHYAQANREVEQDLINYNATTGQVRTPPRYIMSPIDDPRKLDHDNMFTIGPHSTISSSHLLGSNGGYHH